MQVIRVYRRLKKIHGGQLFKSVFHFLHYYYVADSHALVALTFYSILPEWGAKSTSRISQLLIEHNIKLNIDPILVISSLIENTAQIGRVGAAVLIFGWRCAHR